jgi:hypothetical protein
MIARYVLYEKEPLGGSGLLAASNRRHPEFNGIN